jgi:anti-sigma factor RsiW
MNDHDDIQELLELAAAGALDQAEEERVERHMRSCNSCAEEFESLRLLAEGLRRLPTPQPSRGLVERTRARAEIRLAEESEQRWHRGVMVFLVLFAWVVTLVSWPVYRFVSGGLLGMLEPQWNQAWIRFAGFTTIVWMAGGAAALLIGLQQRGERRLA